MTTRHLFTLKAGLLTGLGSLLFSCADSESDSALAPEVSDDSEVTIVKSPNDTRSYRYLVLDNELRVVLVHRPEEGKGGAALAVARGSNHDLPQHEGIAHYLEHMLFLGTEKYPDPDEYSDFISKYGGNNNAFTANEFTNYFFDIDEDYFPEALDRFAQFFVAPLMDEAYVEREKNAVHSEYQMQMRVDAWRGFSVLKTVMNPEHPMSRFNIGSLETLKDIDRELVLKYYQDHYSADQMILVVVSERTLDELESLVLERFSDVPNRNQGDAEIPPSIYLADSLPLAYGYKTIMSNRSLTLEWPVPDIRPHYRSKPLSYLGNLIGHEGKGSLHELLQDRGWINSLSAGGNADDRGNSSFNVSIAVTDAGWSQLNEIRALLFEYIDAIKATPIEEWRFDELSTMRDLDFRFMEHGSSMATVNRLVTASFEYEPEDLLRGPYLMSTFDGELIEDYLKYLTRENSITTISAPDVETQHTEKWFNVEYTLDPAIDLDYAVEHEFVLPEPNGFIPDDTTVAEGEHSAVPTQLRDEGGVAIWHALDTTFSVPRAFVSVRMQYEEPLDDAADAVHNSLLVRLLNIKFNADSYPAILAGLSGSFQANSEGLGINISGYDNKQALMLDTMLDMLASFEVDPEQLENQKTELSKSYSNFKDERPFQQAFSSINHILSSFSWAPSILNQHVAGVTAETLTQWLADRLDTVSVTLLVVGNSQAKDALALGDSIAGKLNVKHFPRNLPKVHSLTTARTYNLAVNHDDAVYLAAVQGKDESIEERAAIRLIAQIVSQDYFNDLRTDQQLGYVTIAQSTELTKHPHLMFLVQSPVADSEGLQLATTTFIAKRGEELRAMSDEEFNDFKQGLLTDLLDEDKNLGERSARYYSDLVNQVETFDTREQLATAIEALSIDDVRSAYSRILESDGSNQLEIYSPGKSGTVLANGVAIDDTAAFKPKSS